MENFIIAAIILSAVIFGGFSIIKSIKHKKETGCCSDKKCSAQNCSSKKNK